MGSRLAGLGGPHPVQGLKAFATLGPPAICGTQLTPGRVFALGAPHWPVCAAACDTGGSDRNATPVRGLPQSGGGAVSAETGLRGVGGNCSLNTLEEVEGDGHV